MYFQSQDSERVCEPADFRPTGDALQPLRRPRTRPQSQRVARWEIALLMHFCGGESPMR